ncbi:MAG: prenyltransferase/squalene oxidase repeat-containing protein, partial [Verrucomicrobiia bacterium]
VYFLLDRQNKDGSWGSPRNTKGLNIYAPGFQSHYAFRLAVTSLCVSALIETGGDTPQTRAALKDAEAYLLEHLPKLRRADATAMYNVWSHGYGLQALVRLRARAKAEPAKIKKIDALIAQQFKMLGRYESVDGGWGYYDMRLGTMKPASSSISFVNATVLVAFHEAKMAGLEPPKKLVTRALAALKRQHLPDGSFLYGEYLKYSPRRGINRPGGSLGRSQAGNIALRLWGDKRITDKVLVDWLDRLYARNDWLGIGRKRPRPHEAWFQVAGYFYYYGHYYGALCLDHVPAAERPRLQDHMATIIMKYQEKDGSWWDFPFYDYHQQYGTAMALMTLQRCLKTKSPKAPAVPEK